jgi:hypothetical protein
LQEKVRGWSLVLSSSKGNFKTPLKHFQLTIRLNPPKLSVLSIRGAGLYSSDV